MHDVGMQIVVDPPLIAFMESRRAYCLPYRDPDPAMKLLSRQQPPDELAKTIRAWFEHEGGGHYWRVGVFSNKDIQAWLRPTGDVVSGDPTGRELIIVNMDVWRALEAQMNEADEVDDS